MKVFEKWSSSLVSREIQTEATLIIHFNPRAWLRSADTKCRRGRGERRTCIHCWWECKQRAATLEIIVENPEEKLKINLSYDPALSLLDICSKNLTSDATKLFAGTILTIARRWKQPKRLSADGLAMKTQYIQTMDTPQP